MIQPLVTTTTYNVILALCESPLGLARTCIYKPRLFGAKAIDRLLRDFENIVEKFVTQPEIPISAIDVSLKSKR